MEMRVNIGGKDCLCWLPPLMKKTHLFLDASFYVTCIKKLVMQVRADYDLIGDYFLYFLFVTSLHDFF